MANIQFILGRAGSGKTTQLTRRVRDLVAHQPLGPAIVLIVPDQATLLYERFISCQVIPQGNTRVRVVSFTMLGREILAQTGNVTIPELTPLGRRLLLHRSLIRNAGSLGYFGSSSRHVGVVDPVMSLLRELEKCDRTADDLRYLALDVRPDNPQLADKLADLATIDIDYRSAVSDNRLDPARRERLVLEAIAHAPLLKDAHVFLDDFDRFSPIEQRWLVAMSARCASMTFALLKSDIHHDLVDLVSGFIRPGNMMLPDVVCDRPVRFASSDLTAVEFTFDSDTPGVRQKLASPAVRLLTLPDPAAAAVAVAREIATLVSAGTRYRDIVVLTREPLPYTPLLQAALKDRGIPHFIDARRPATAHPLTRVATALLKIAEAGFTTEAVITLLKSKLVTGVSSDAAEQFEMHCTEHRITPESFLVGPWNFAETDEDLAVDVSIEETPSNTADVESIRVLLVRATVALRELFVTRERRINPADLCGALMNAMGQLGVLAELSREIETAVALEDFDLAQQHQQVWAQLSNTLDQVVDLLGQESVDPADARLLIEQSLSHIDLAIVPPTLDQIVVGTVERTRTHPDTRVTFVVGLNEGEFPARPSTEAIFSDADRLDLRGRGVDVEPPQAARDTERELAYFAFTRASQRLYLVRSLVDSARTRKSPGRFWRQVEAVVGKSPKPIEPVDTKDTIDTPAALAQKLLTWANSASPLLDTATASLYQQVALSKDDPQLEPVRFALRAVDYRNDAELSDDARQQLWQNTSVVSARQIESFNSCAFQHFVRHGLSIRPTIRPGSTLDDFTIQRAERKAVMYLSRFQTSRASQEPFAASPVEIASAAGRAVDDLCSRYAVAPQRRRRLTTRVTRVLGEFNEYQKLIAQLDSSRPVLTDVWTHDRHGKPLLNPLTVTTPSGRVVQIRLSIDRVDLVPPVDGSGPTLARAVSLRTGSVSASSAKRHELGIAIEMELRLLFLMENAAALRLAEVSPAATLAMRIARRVTHLGRDENVDDEPLSGTLDHHLVEGRKPRGKIVSPAALPFKAAKSAGYLALTRTDVIDTDELNNLLITLRRSVGEQLDHLLCGDIRILPYLIGGNTPCSTCDYRSVCRFEYPLNSYRIFEGTAERETDGDS